MKKYIALYVASNNAIDEMMKSSTPEGMKEGMQKWFAWGKAHEKDVIDLGNPAGKNKRITSGGIADVRNEVCGYTLVRADSHDAAAELFTDNPHLDIPGGYIEVLECVDISGM